MLKFGKEDLRLCFYGKVIDRFAGKDYKDVHKNHVYAGGYATNRLPSLCRYEVGGNAVSINHLMAEKKHAGALVYRFAPRSHVFTMLSKSFRPSTSLPLWLYTP